MIRFPRFLLILLAGFVATPAVAQVGGTRTLPQGCTTGEQAVVSLDLEVGADVPNGAIVVEKLPEGWTLSSATPTQSSYNPATREVRWLFYGAAVNDQDLDIQYSVVAGSEAAPFGGSILFNDATGSAQAQPIIGDVVCELATPCTGDCDGNHTVTIDEVIRQIAIALGGGPVTACPAADGNGDGMITVDDVVSAINNALNGCPAS